MLPLVARRQVGVGAVDLLPGQVEVGEGGGVEVEPVVDSVEEPQVVRAEPPAVAVARRPAGEYKLRKSSSSVLRFKE